MLHGLIYATYAERLKEVNDRDFADDVHDFFGGGTQLQELYLTPRMMDAQNWDDVAEAAKWSRANADVLVDTHWIGGDPAQAEVYGWAAWSPRKGILVLRNPELKAGDHHGRCPGLVRNSPRVQRALSALRSPWQAGPVGPGHRAAPGNGAHVHPGAIRRFGLGVGTGLKPPA